jgi:hypothetical protein
VVVVYLAAKAARAAMIAMAIMGSLPMIACSQVDEVTPRARVAAMLADTFEFRQRLAAELQSSEVTLHGGPIASLKGQGRFDFGWVTSTGVVTLYGDDVGVIVVLEPVKDAKAIRWHCVVYPEKFKPNVCR